MDKHKYFTLNEMTFSETAVMNGINNFPEDEDVLENLDKLMTWLDDFREYYGKPIRVTSGYRCKKLNNKVGGVSNSAHMYGYAADIQPLDYDHSGLSKAISKYVKEKNVDFD